MNVERVRGAVRPVVILLAAVIAGQAVSLVGPDRALIPIPVVVRSLPFGALNAMFAVGLIVVYRSGRFINFSHASFGTLAASVFLTMQADDLPFGLAVAIGIGAALAAAVITEVLVLRRFAASSRLVITVVTIALAQLLGAIASFVPQIRFGPREFWPGDPARSPVSDRAVQWFPETFTGDDVVVVLAALAVMVGIAGFLRFTSAGIAVRGASENAERAALLGVNTNNLATAVWVMAGGLAAAAAVLQVLLQGATLPATVTAAGAGIGAGNLLRALAAAVVGRMENLPTAVAAAFGVAVFERSVFWSFTQTPIVDGVLLLVIVGVLLVQRSRLGRVGEAETSTWAAAEEVRPIPHELEGHPSVRTGMKRFGTLLVVVLLAYPWIMSPAQTNLGALYAIYGIVAVSLVVLTGWGGQISLGQFGFVAIGAVVGGALTGRWGVPFLVAIPVASAVGGLAAVALGLPALRIRGLYLAVTTLAFSVATATVLLNPRYFGWLLPDRVDRPVFLWIDSEDERVFYYLSIAALLLAVFVAKGLRSSRTGRVLIAMRDNERVAQAMGLSLARIRLATFALSGALAAFAGVLFAHHQHAVTEEAFAPEQSIQMFLMALIGGLGSVTGVVLGAIYLGSLTIFLSGGPQRLLASGVGVLLVLVAFPAGIGGLSFTLRDAWLRRIAIRDRIHVPSLTGNLLHAGARARAVLAPKLGPDGGRVKVPVRYRRDSVIGIAGASQQGKERVY